MGATIQINGARARVEDREWACDNERLQRLLNIHTEGFLAIYHKGYDPNPDLTIAENVVQTFGGKLVSFDEVEAEEGVIY